MDNVASLIDKINLLINMYEKTKNNKRKYLIEDEILKLNNSWIAYYFVREVTKVSRIDEFDKLIADARNPYLSFLFIRNNYKIKCLAQEGLKNQYKINFYIHEGIILDSNEPYLNYQFARRYHTPDILKHGQVVIDSGILKLNYLFARDVSGADIIKHGKVILESGDLQYNYIFARDIRGAEVRKHGQIIIDSKDYQYNFDFAKDVPYADVESHVNVLRNLQKEQVTSNVERQFLKNEDLGNKIDNIIKKVKKRK